MPQFGTNESERKKERYRKIGGLRLVKGKRKRADLCSKRYYILYIILETKDGDKYYSESFHDEREREHCFPASGKETCREAGNDYRGVWPREKRTASAANILGHKEIYKNYIKKKKEILIDRQRRKLAVTRNELKTGARNEARDAHLSNRSCCRVSRAFSKKRIIFIICFFALQRSVLYC